MNKNKRKQQKLAQKRHKHDLERKEKRKLMKRLGGYNSFVYQQYQAQQEEIQKDIDQLEKVNPLIDTRLG